MELGEEREMGHHESAVAEGILVWLCGRIKELERGTHVSTSLICGLTGPRESESVAWAGS